MLIVTVAEPLNVPLQVASLTEVNEYVVVEVGETFSVNGLVEVTWLKVEKPSVYPTVQGAVPLKLMVSPAVCPEQIEDEPEISAVGDALMVTFAVVVFGHVPLVKLYVTV
jgi:hypothetical protein